MYMDNDNNFVQKSLEDDDTLKEFRVKLSQENFPALRI